MTRSEAHPTGTDSTPGVLLSHGLHTRFALPSDTDLDEFSSGVKEVDSYFRSRQWFNATKGKAAPPTYQFLTEEGGEVVGYAALAFRNSDHLNDGSGNRAKYLMIYVVGLHELFQGEPNPRDVGHSYAQSVFLVINELARDKTACVGLCLWVREDNPRAIAFYRKCGFEGDTGGATARDEGAPHLTMRKLF